MKVLFANPTIAPHVKHTLQAYLEKGCLDRYCTSFYYNSDSYFSAVLSKIAPSINREFSRRLIAEVPAQLVKTRPIPELLRVFSSRKMSHLFADKIWEWSELNFDRWVASQLTKKIDWVHTAEHAGLRTIKRAKTLGVLTIHEQPSPHHKFYTDIVLRQKKLYKEFNDQASSLLHDGNAIRRNTRRDEELHLADYVLCNSSFTRRTLAANEIDEKKIITVPLGFPDVEEHDRIFQNERLIFMYAGNLNLLKGTHLLLQAWKELNPKNAELHLVGRNLLPEIFFRDLPENVLIKSQVPHSELMQLYKKADVFILPSLSDGFGMVISEAMSRGLPVITTSNSGGADLISNEENGLIIEPESKEAIAQSLQWYIENRHRLSSMSGSAYAKAASYPWPSFQKTLIQQLTLKYHQWPEAVRSA